MYWSDICTICSPDYSYIEDMPRCRHSLRKQFIAAWATRAKWCKSCNQFSRHHEKQPLHNSILSIMDDKDYHKWYSLASTKSLTEAEMQIYMDSPLRPTCGPDLIVQKFCERQKITDSFIAKNVDELTEYADAILSNSNARLSSEYSRVLQFNWDNCSVNSIHYWLHASRVECLSESTMQKYLSTYRENFTKSKWYATQYKSQDSAVLKNFLMYQTFSEKFILDNIYILYNLVDSDVLYAQKENFTEEFLQELENMCSDMLNLEELLFVSMEDTREQILSDPASDENVFVHIEQTDLLK